MSLLTVEEAANRLRVHPETVRRMIRRGELAAIRVGTIWRIDETDLAPERIVRQPRPPRHDPSPLAEFVRPEWLRREKVA